MSLEQAYNGEVVKILGVLMVALVCSGCSMAAARHANHVTLGLALITTACDWHETRWAAGDGWSKTYEANPIMGEEPSTTTVDVYNAAVIGATVGLGQLVPEQYRWLVYGAVAAAGVESIIVNSSTTPGLCGFSGGPAR